MALADTQAMHSVCGPHTITPRFPHKENSLAKSCQGCLLVSPRANMTSYHDVNKAQGWECLGAQSCCYKTFCPSLGPRKWRGTGFVYGFKRRAGAW